MNLEQLVMEVSTNNRTYYDITTDIENLVTANPDSLKNVDQEVVSKLVRLFEFNCGRRIQFTDLIVKHASNLSPLQKALLQGDAESVEILLKNGEKLEGPQWYLESLVSFTFCMKNTNTRKDLLKLLIKYSFDAKYHNSKCENLLHQFSRYGKVDDTDAVEVVEVLINSGALINQRTIAGYLPLDFAVNSRNHSLATLLIEKGSELKIKRKPGGVYASPLNLFAGSSNTDMIDLLLSNGHGINEHDSTMFERTPLSQACAFHSVQSISFLIQKGADVNAEDDRGYTPLRELSSRSGKYYQCITLLVKEFARLKYKNLAVSKKNMDLMKTNPTACKIFEKCTNELKLMAETIFYKPYSYYFVMKTSYVNKKKLANLTKNEEFITKFKGKLDEFSYYTDYLERIFAEAVKVRDESLIVESKLKTIFADFLPEIVIRKLADNLNIKDLPSQE